MYLGAVDGQESYVKQNDGSTIVYDSDGVYVGTIPGDGSPLSIPSITGTDWGAVAKGIATTWQGIQTSKINVARAQQGLPPLDIATATVGLQPSQMNQIMLLGGAAVLVLFLVNRKGR